MKKRVVVNYKNLSDELKLEVRKKYPSGYHDNMIRIDKGPGNFFYAIMLETEDISYLIKVDVKIDNKVNDDDDKDYYFDEVKDEEIIGDNDSEE